MKLLKSFLIICLISNNVINAQSIYDKDPESCTSIMVGKQATVDGSVITSHTCDSWYRTWVEMVPSAEYKKDTVVSIYDGLMHTEYVKDMTNVKKKGEIPQATHTYAFMNTAYPCINEKQLAIGETTISGRKELVNSNGMFMIEELQRIVLQRCTTARSAIKLMGELIKKYGYADSGECLTIADINEVWHFEVFGEGKDNIGGVWAAIKIPDDHVGVSANISRISTLDLKDKNNCMASDNVFEVARRLKYWDGKETFKFWKAYSGKNYFGEVKAFSIREYFILSSLAPSLKLDYDAEELPISVKPDKHISTNDVINMLKQTYEGTEWDITKNLKIVVKNKDSEKNDTIISPNANPWMRPDEIKMLNGIKDGTVKTVRNVAVPQCAYSTVIQLRGWLPNEIGGIVWFSMDNPAQSPRIPIYCGVTDFPDLFKTCGNHRFREDAALWHYRKANKLATLKWGTFRKVMENNISHFENKGNDEKSYVENRYMQILKDNGELQAKEFLTNYTTDFIGATIMRWDEMANKYWIESKFGF